MLDTRDNPSPQGGSKKIKRGTSLNHCQDGGERSKETKVPAHKKSKDDHEDEQKPR